MRVINLKKIIGLSCLDQAIPQPRPKPPCSWAVVAGSAKLLTKLSRVIYFEDIYLNGALRTEPSQLECNTDPSILNHQPNQQTKVFLSDLVYHIQSTPDKRTFWLNALVIPLISEVDVFIATFSGKHPPIPWVELFNMNFEGTILVGFKFHGFFSLYPQYMRMVIKYQHLRIKTDGCTKENIVALDLVYHSLKCNQTIEFSQSCEDELYASIKDSFNVLKLAEKNMIRFYPDFSTDFVFSNKNNFSCLYMSRSFLIRYDKLQYLNKSFSIFVTLTIQIFSESKKIFGGHSFSLQLSGWRRICPSSARSSLIITDIFYDKFDIRITINDIRYRSKEVSVIRIENGDATILPESQIAFTNLNFKKFEQQSLKLYQDGQWFVANAPPPPRIPLCA
ncbi:hypothetical protein RF11_09533 [Thelohanellus kitauei]|uniref:Uncharacterized protein n=1 Tax=Thelohanellus kitauei TaxID=669202 RepID=A0A0C2J231_THEKT|nr:hypothetical protein RF11_09533 [Thelohanellus kitauei]